jgi:hypothetical protein
VAKPKGTDSTTVALLRMDMALVVVVVNCEDAAAEGIPAGRSGGSLSRKQGQQGVRDLFSESAIRNICVCTVEDRGL